MGSTDAGASSFGGPCGNGLGYSCTVQHTVEAAGLGRSPPSSVICSGDAEARSAGSLRADSAETKPAKPKAFG
jgi:hypothetical protein